MNKYAERLYKEWSQHGKIVIAVDYDSTIYPWHTINNKEDISLAIKILREAIVTGAYIVINTCSDISRRAEIHMHCNNIGLRIDGINSNPIELPYGKHGKVYANIYIDDRAGMLEALEILSEAMYRIRGDRMKQIAESELN